MNFRVGNVPFTSPSSTCRSRRAVDAPLDGRRGAGTSMATVRARASRPATADGRRRRALRRRRRALGATARGSGSCMIASLDGSTVVDGRVRAASATPPTRRCSAPCAGPPTSCWSARARCASRATGRRKQAGLRIGVVTRPAASTPTSALFTSGAGFLVMPEDGPPDPRRRSTSCAPARARRPGARPAPPRRRASTPPTFVQAEGGPRLNGALLDADCVDELDLTISPVLVGGDGAAAATGAAPDARRASTWPTWRPTTATSTAAGSRRRL